MSKLAIYSLCAWCCILAVLTILAPALWDGFIDRDEFPFLLMSIPPLILGVLALNAANKEPPA
jgi:hypothetical protein